MQVDSESFNLQIYTNANNVTNSLRERDQFKHNSVSKHDDI